MYRPPLQMGVYVATIGNLREIGQSNFPANSEAGSSQCERVNLNRVSTAFCLVRKRSGEPGYRLIWIGAPPKEALSPENSLLFVSNWA